MLLEIEIRTHCIASRSMCSAQLKLHRCPISSSAPAGEQARGSPHSDFVNEHTKRIRHKLVFLEAYTMIAQLGGNPPSFAWKPQLLVFRTRRRHRVERVEAPDFSRGLRGVQASQPMPSNRILRFSAGEI